MGSAALVWLALGVAYLGWGRDPLVDLLAPLGQPGLTSWFTFKRQSLLYAAFIPFAVALGLIAGPLRAVGQHSPVRWVVVGLALAIALPYTLGTAWPFARESFGLAVFVVLLMPWPPTPFTVWPQLASESYAIYILHYGIAQALVLALRRLGIEAGDGVILVTAMATFIIALLLALLSRRLPLASWLLPRVPARTTARA